MKSILVPVLVGSVLILSACGGGEPQGPKEQATSKAIASGFPQITATQAVEAARKLAGPDWRLAFLSNTGVTGDVTSSDLSGPADALMKRNGQAGQWVVEFFRDAPKRISEGGQTGNAYPLLRVLVTALKTEGLPESELAVPQRLAELSEGAVASIDAAIRLAVDKSGEKFDVLSVASDVRSSGETSWRFRFYDLSSGAIVAQVRVSADGSRQLDW